MKGLPLIGVTAMLEGGRTGIEPHRILVVASIESARSGTRPAALALVEVMRLAYELERGRRSAGVSFHLDRADLLAAVAEADVDPRWLGLLLTSAGALPIGAHVRLHDGRVAIVMGRGVPGEPFRPEVMVAGGRFVPQLPVTLLASRRAR